MPDQKSEYEMALREAGKRYGVGTGEMGLFRIGSLSQSERKRARWIHAELTRMKQERDDDRWKKLRQLAAEEPGAEEPPE